MSVSKINLKDNNNNENNNLPSRYSTNKLLLFQSKTPNNGGAQSPFDQILKRARVNLFLSKEDKITKYIKEDIESNLITVKNPESLYNYLISLKNFKQYIKIYNFTFNQITESFKGAKYVKLKKNFKLFNQGDKTDFFYLLVSGYLGLVLNVHSLKSNIKTKEINTLKPGSYFGEWGFIFKINRTVSAYAKEDSLLLKFDKNIFKQYYQENIINLENHTKKFVLNHIKTLKKLGFSAFNHYYRDMKKIFCVDRTAIFHKGEKADSFYLIYRGTCAVKNGLNNLMIKDVGDFIGIESLFCDEYETTIYTHSEDTMLFSFTIHLLSNNIVDDLKEEFLEYYKNQKTILKLWEDNFNMYKNRLRLNFFDLVKNMEDNKIKNYKLLNDLKLDEMNINKIKIKKGKYLTRNKSKISFNVSNISTNYFNKSESMKIISPKTTKNNNRNKSFHSDIKNKYIFNQISKSLNHSSANDINNMNNSNNLQSKKDKNINVKVQIYNSLKGKNKFKLKKNKKNLYSYFVDEAVEKMLPAYKKINIDNHFSNQNFKLKRKRINSAFIKSKLKNNTIKKNEINTDLNIKKNYFLSNAKIEKALELLSKDFFKGEKRTRNHNKSNIIENEKNINNFNNDIPIMIIRNYSSFSN